MKFNKILKRKKECRW